MNRAFRTSILCFFVYAATAVANSPAVEFSHEVAPTQVGVVSTTRAQCTGTLIDSGLILTDAKCFPAAGERAAFWFPSPIDSSGTVHWIGSRVHGGIVGSLGGDIDFKVAPGKKHEFAILRAGGMPLADSAPLTLLDVGVGQLQVLHSSVSLLGYQEESSSSVGHMPFSRYYQSGCKIAAPADGSAGMTHNCDPQDLVAGAPILLRQFGQYYVVGIHVGSGLMIPARVLEKAVVTMMAGPNHAE